MLLYYNWEVREELQSSHSLSLSLCLNISPALSLLPATDTQPTTVSSESPTVPSESPTVTSITVTETPFYREAAFIVGMVILGVVLVFTACAIFLCCVRPRGNAGYKVTGSYELDTMPLTTPTRTTPTRTTPTRSGLKHAKPQQQHATVTWTPGDPTWVSTQTSCSVWSCEKMEKKIMCDPATI